MYCIERLKYDTPHQKQYIKYLPMYSFLDVLRLTLIGIIKVY